MGKLIDITDQRFGKLTVIQNEGKLDGRHYFWKCICDCGKEVVKEGSQLRAGNVKSCGCGKYDGLKRYNMEQSEKALIEPGRKFGKLTVIKSIGFKQQVEGHKRRWYLCKCDCGNVKEVMGNMLTQNQVMSCGLCNLRSQGEYLIQKILEENNIPYLYDTVYLPLVQETQRKLRFDFIIYEDNNYTTPIRFIEYDGRQHTQGHDFGAWSHEEPFEIIQERDQIKNNFCQKHNLTLVRIPYTNKKITLEDIMGDRYIMKGDDECD